MRCYFSIDGTVPRLHIMGRILRLNLDELQRLVNEMVWVLDTLRKEPPCAT